MKRFLGSHYFVFLCFFAVFCVLMIPNHIRPGTDDTAWLADIHEKGIFHWVWAKAVSWQPRLFSDFCIAFFSGHVGVWKIANALMLTLMLFTTDKIVTAGLNDMRRHRYISLAVTASFFLIFPYVVTSSVFWFAGSLNYLWPLTLTLIALVPFFFALRGEEAYQRKWLTPIYLICAVLGEYTEQTAAVSICFSLFSVVFLLLQKRRLPVCLWIQLAVILANGLIFLYANFTSPRAIGQTEMNYLPGFQNLSGLKKLFLGMNVTNDHLITSSNLILLSLALLAGYAVWRRFSDRPSVRVLSFVPAFYVLLSVIPFRPLLSGVWMNTVMNAGVSGHASAADYDTSKLFDIIYSAYPLDDKPAGFADLIPSGLAMLMILLLAVLIFFAFKDRGERFTAVVLYFAALASGYIMGFSPTIFASGSRAFFLANIFLLIIIAMFVRQFLTASLARDTEGYSEPIKFSGKMKLLLFIIALLVVHSIMLYWEVYSPMDWIY